jgi:hypothetical protein
VATLVTSTLAPPTQSITGVYAGDSNNAKSTSLAYVETINPPTFSVSTPTTPATVLSGQSTTSTFTVTPTGGPATFVGAVTLTVTGLPANTTYSFSTNPIPAGSTATPETLTITTTGPNLSGGVGQHQHKADNRVPLFPLAFPLAGIVMVGFAGRKMSKYSVMVGLCVSLALLGLLVACGGGSSGPPPVTVTPNSAQVPLGGTQQFSASQSTVTWTLSAGAPGAISSSGLYTAPTSGTTPVNLTVTATPTTGAAGTASVTIPAVTVSVQSTPTSVYPNDSADGWPAQTAQFTATVANASNTAVTWAVTTPNGGTIDANGVYTAPTIATGLPTSVVVTATPAADTTKSGTGAETLSPATVPGTYPIMVTATESTTVNSKGTTLTVR